MSLFWFFSAQGSWSRPRFGVGFDGAGTAFEEQLSDF
jgi:hypothetical protein